MSQVLLALHITLPEGEWGGVGGEEEIIGGAGRECCSVKVHYSSHHVSWLQPRMAPGLTSLSPSSSRLHPSLLSSSASVTFRFHLSLHLSVFCLSLSRVVLAQTDPINPIVARPQLRQKRARSKIVSSLFFFLLNLTLVHNGTKLFRFCNVL